MVSDPEALEILNHENVRVGNILDKTVSSDTYLSDETRRNDERSKLDEWHKEIDKKFTRAVTKDEVTDDARLGKRGQIDTTTKVLAAVFGALALLGTLITVSLALLNYQALHSNSTTTVTVPVVTVTP